MNIEIFSDLVCPWCYIGKRRLDQALAGNAGEGVAVIWRAYQLYPGIPEPGMSRKEFGAARYGGADQSAARTRLEAEAAGAGIDMDFGRISRMPNTFASHRLLHRARAWGVQHELAESLFSAYFEQGRDVGDPEVLADVAAGHGMQPEDVREYLAGSEGRDEVEGELMRAENIGVTGVPCFVLAGKFALPGAQEADVIGHFLERARAKLAEAD